MKRAGFTLVELLIATTVFSVIMVISMYGFIRISKYYTKGTTVARMENSARNIIGDISNSIQFSVGNKLTQNYPTAFSPGKICIGNKRYTYLVNTPQGFNGKDAIYSEEATGSNCGTITASTKQVLLPNNSRILNLTVKDLGYGNLDVYKLKIMLLYVPDVPVSFIPSANQPGTDLVQVGFPADDLTQWKCKLGVRGSEYCAITTVSTIVYGRL